MTLLLKDPEAVLDYSIDWGSEYVGGSDLLVASDWSVLPDESGGLAVCGSAFDAGVTTVKAGGGVPGHVYRLINRVTLESGRVDDRSMVIRVEAR